MYEIGETKRLAKRPTADPSMPCLPLPGLLPLRCSGSFLRDTLANAIVTLDHGFCHRCHIQT